jgi:hypothetical protein
LGLIIVIMGAAYLYARRQGPVEERDDEVSLEKVTSQG